MELAQNLSTNSTFNITASFPLILCYYVDFPPNKTDCSQKEPTRCVQCKMSGFFFNGDTITEFVSTYYLFYPFIWVMSLIVALAGILSSVIIVMVITKKKESTHKSFQYLLILLAVADAICCLAAIFGSTGEAAWFGNWFGKGKAMLYWAILSVYIPLFFRSVSSYITVLITVKGYLLIAFPVKAYVWLDLRKIKFVVLGTLGFVILTGHPRFFSFSVEPNEWKDVKSIEDLDYIVRTTAYGRFWYGTLKAIHNKVDWLLALPSLIIFNMLSFWKVRQLSKRRKELNMTQVRDIRAVKMFLPVVIAYFFTQTAYFASGITISRGMGTSRELFMLGHLTQALNSAVNLPIYCLRNVSFREDARNEVNGILIKLGLKKERKVDMLGVKVTSTYGSRETGETSI